MASSLASSSIRFGMKGVATTWGAEPLRDQVFAKTFLVALGDIVRPGDPGKQFHAGIERIDAQHRELLEEVEEMLGHPRVELAAEVLET